MPMTAFTMHRSSSPICQFPCRCEATNERVGLPASDELNEAFRGPRDPVERYFRQTSSDTS